MLLGIEVVPGELSDAHAILEGTYQFSGPGILEHLLSDIFMLIIIAIITGRDKPPLASFREVHNNHRFVVLGISQQTN